MRSLPAFLHSPLPTKNMYSVDEEIRMDGISQVVEVLQNKEKHQEDRDNQMKQIEKAWEGFLNVLEQTGKLR